MRRRRQAPDFDENEDWTHILLDATGGTEEEADALVRRGGMPDSRMVEPGCHFLK